MMLYLRGLAALLLFLPSLMLAAESERYELIQGWELQSPSFRITTRAPLTSVTSSRCLTCDQTATESSGVEAVSPVPQGGEHTHTPPQSIAETSSPTPSTSTAREVAPPEENSGEIIQEPQEDREPSRGGVETPPDILPEIATPDDLAPVPPLDLLANIAPAEGGETFPSSSTTEGALPSPRSGALQSGAGGRGNASPVIAAAPSVQRTAKRNRVAEPLYRYRRGSAVYLSTRPHAPRKQMVTYHDAQNEGKVLVAGHTQRNDSLVTVGHFAPLFTLILFLLFVSLLFFTNAFLRLALLIVGGSTLLLLPLEGFAMGEEPSPLLLPYSGYLLDHTGQPVRTAHILRFSTWTSADAVPEDGTLEGDINTLAPTYAGWVELHTVTPEESGYFSVQLGHHTPLSPLLDQLLRHRGGLFLQVEVRPDGIPGAIYELLDHDPREEATDRSPLPSVPFALLADQVDHRDIGTASGSIPVLVSGGVFEKRQIPGGTLSDFFTIDADDTSTEISLRFGETIGQALTYVDDRFNFTDDVAIAGDLSVEGEVKVGGDLTVGGKLTVNGVPLPHAILTLEEADGRYLHRAGEVLQELAIEGGLTSGGSVGFSSLPSCSTLQTDPSGILTCGEAPKVLRTVRKASDEVIEEREELQRDDDLFFAVGPYETWAFTFHLLGSAPWSADLLFAVDAPPGSRCAYTVHSEGRAQASAHTTCGESSERLSTRKDINPYVVEGTIVTGEEGGELALLWAQGRARPVETIIHEGSWLTAQRVE